MNDVAVRVRVSGWVQGVSFRWTCELEAERLGVRGWVRNEPDGDVAGHFEGEPAAVDALVEWCRRGPAGSRVERVVSESAEPEGLTRFQVRY